MDGDLMLFGALPGAPLTCILTVENPEEGTLGRVKVDVFCKGRRDPMRLQMDHLTAERMPTAIGYAIPLVVKSHYVGTAMMRRHFWAIQRTLAVGGWECIVKGCGVPSKK